MKKVFKANLYFFLILVLEVFGGMIYGPFIRDFKLPIQALLAINHILIFIVPAIIYFLITKESVKDTLRLNKISFKEVCLAILIGFLCQPIVIFFSYLTSLFFVNDVQVVMNQMKSAPYIILLLLIAVMPAITEEITLRGIVLKGYDNKSCVKASIVIGLFFGMFHLTESQFLYAAFLGGLFAYLVRITNSIYTSAIIHFTVNGLQVTLGTLGSKISANVNKDQVESMMNVSSAQKISGIIFFGVLAIGFSILVYIAVKEMKNVARRRGVVDTYEKNTLVSTNNYNEDDWYKRQTRVKDNIINIPFILSILFYIIVMVGLK